MKKLLITVLLFICFSPEPLKAQQVKGVSISGIDVNQIFKMVQDTQGVYYYPKLLQRFEKNDSTLLGIDLQMLYYGFATQANYNPYVHFATEDSLSYFNEQQKPQQTLKIANRLLEQNPVSIFGNVEKAFALHALKQEETALRFLARYNALISAAETSGVGDSYENPIVLISPKDAQAFILRYKLTKLENTLNGQNGKYYDVYLVRNEEGKQYPIYFDITIPYTIGMQRLQESGG